ncbi:MAG: hypothetical protein KC431_23430, partial [Myxococcales bacterium]|nr:hypothetical protein [Myxococcales bacterium]
MPRKPTSHHKHLLTIALTLGATGAMPTSAQAGESPELTPGDGALAMIHQLAENAMAPQSSEGDLAMLPPPPPPPWPESTFWRQFWRASPFPGV